MSEDIRQTHYDAWARTKKWADIKVTQLNLGIWRGESINGHIIAVLRPTRILAIQAIQMELHRVGYEVRNLPEIMGIVPSKPEEERHTFLEWLSLLKLKHDYFKWSEPTPEHKLKDPSMDEKIAAAELRGYRKALKDVDEIRKVKVRMPEGKIEYRP